MLPRFTSPASHRPHHVCDTDTLGRVDTHHAERRQETHSALLLQNIFHLPLDLRSCGSLQVGSRQDLMMSSSVNQELGTVGVPLLVQG